MYCNWDFHVFPIATMSFKVELQYVQAKIQKSPEQNEITAKWKKWRPNTTLTCTNWQHAVLIQFNSNLRGQCRNLKLSSICIRNCTTLWVKCPADSTACVEKHSRQGPGVRSRTVYCQEWRTGSGGATRSTRRSLWDSRAGASSRSSWGWNTDPGVCPVSQSPANSVHSTKGRVHKWNAKARGAVVSAPRNCFFKFAHYIATKIGSDEPSLASLHWLGPEHPGRRFVWLLQSWQAGTGLGSAHATHRSRVGTAGLRITRRKCMRCSSSLHTPFATVSMSDPGWMAACTGHRHWA